MMPLRTTTNAMAKVIIDPVCGMNVPPGKRDLVSEHEERIYYFCAEVCLKSFDEDPQKYVGRKSAKRKGFFGRYLDRLSRANKEQFGSAGPKCH